VGAALLGVGSSVFHPESSRVARMASGGRHGLAQSLFQVGGNTGAALGPLAAALVVVRWGQSSLAFFALLAAAVHRDPVERGPLVQASRAGAAASRRGGA
jgi:MFS transporter, FSR family, fosmidomycin resistance protein